jgi:cytochrome c556
MKLIARVTTLVLVMTASGVAFAADDAKNLVEYRWAVMSAFGGHAGAIAKVVKGEAPYTEHVSRHAAAIATTASMVRDIFPKGTGPDAFADTDALPAIWEKPDAFKKAQDDFVAAAAEFAEAAKSDDRKTVLVGFKKLGDACGACHKDFRKEKK